MITPAQTTNPNNPTNLPTRPARPIINSRGYAPVGSLVGDVTPNRPNEPVSLARVSKPSARALGF